MIDIDTFSALNPYEMKIALNKARKTANARLTRLEKAGLSDISIAYHNVMSDKERFSARKSNRASMRAEYKRILEFMNDKTALVSGTRELWKRTENAFGQKLSVEEVTNVWRLYNAWKKNNRGLFNRLGSEQVQSLVGEVFSSNKNTEEMLNEIQASALTSYEEQELSEIKTDIWDTLGDDFY